ncbi:MAG: cell division protein ZapD [Nevskia sp.]|nr:cell division protein ZapD [Nevskia sp.]
MQQAAEWIAFEHPLSERIRFLLRLEFLFAELRHHRADASVWGLRAGVHTFLDTLSVMGRTDMRTELLKELADQLAALGRLARRPEVNAARLAQVQGEIGSAIAGLQGMSSSHPAMMLRENEFLFAVLNRSSIPGGICGFDLPAYHRWLARPHDEAERDLETWSTRLRPIERAIGLYLQLLRESSEPIERVAEGGIYLHVPQAPCQLVRVLLPAEADVYPEISAGKHRISIRLMRLGDVNTRNNQAGGSIGFQFQCCHLAGHA